MLRELSKWDDELIMNFLKEETLINYFIIQGIKREKSKETYIKKWGELTNNGDLKAILLKRKSLNMQFYSKGNYDYKEIINILKNEKYHKLIGEFEVLKDIINNYNFSKIVKGAYLCKLDKKVNPLLSEKKYNIKKLSVKDLDRIIEIYHKVFTGFTSKKMMEEKLKNGFGRGYYIEYEGKILSVVQSDYEYNNSAIIVGVATDPNFQGRGYASCLLTKLCNELQDEDKELYLQYDSLDAGKIYEKLGFKIIGRMINCYN